jgi:hypothetical protein
MTQRAVASTADISGTEAKLRASRRVVRPSMRAGEAAASRPRGTRGGTTATRPRRSRTRLSARPHAVPGLPLARGAGPHAGRLPAAAAAGLGPAAAAAGLGGAAGLGEAAGVGETAEVGATGEPAALEVAVGAEAVVEAAAEAVVKEGEGVPHGFEYGGEGRRGPTRWGWRSRGGRGSRPGFRRWSAGVRAAGAHDPGVPADAPLRAARCFVRRSDWFGRGPRMARRLDVVSAW